MMSPVHYIDMRTTVRLEPELLTRAKAHAAATGRSLNTLIEEALRQSLARIERTQPATAVTLPTFAGGRGVRPGIDLDDSASLWELDDEDQL